jgi:hypothetical protein
MADPASTKPLVGWQRANVLAAAQYLVERLRVDPADRRAHAICEGLLDVLKPARKSERNERELAAAKAAILVLPDARKGLDPRSGKDRRTAASAAQIKAERRKRERRLRRDRRKS